MKKPLLWMSSIIGAIAVLVALGLGGYWYFAHRPSAQASTQLSASELSALLVDLPENTTNTKDGLIQFTVHLQASDKKDKSQLTDILPLLQDAVNQSMHEFTNSELKTADGQTRLRQEIEMKVDALLPNGKVSDVYFSTWVVQ